MDRTKMNKFFNPGIFSGPDKIFCSVNIDPEQAVERIVPDGNFCSKVNDNVNIFTKRLKRSGVIKVAGNHFRVQTINGLVLMMLQQTKIHALCQ